MDKALELSKEFCDTFNSPGVCGEVIAPFYATDARFMIPGAPTVVGRANIKLALDEYFKKKGVDDKSKMEMTCEDARDVGDYLLTTGVYKVTADGKDIDVGKFVTIFMKEDGKLKILYDIVNTSK